VLSPNRFKLPMRWLTRFGWMTTGILAGAGLEAFRGPCFTNGPTADLWSAKYRFIGAISGACFVILVRAVVRLSRGRFRVQFSTSSFLEFIAVCMIVGGYAQNWHIAQSDVDAREERLARFSDAMRHPTSPSAAAIIRNEPEQAPDLISSIITYVSTAATVIGALAAVWAWFAGLATLEDRLPYRVRNAVAMGLVGFLAILGFGILLALGFAW
jgi:hypothetical protein